MLEMARIFSTQSFDSTIRFIGFDQEELGLVGSLAYTQAAAAAGDNIALATIFDMIGYTSSSQTPFPTGDAGVFGSFTVSEFRTVGDFIGGWVRTTRKCWPTLSARPHSMRPRFPW